MDERPDGSRVTTVTVTLTNGAPSDCPPSILCGSPEDGPLGAFGAEVHVYMPVGAQVISTTTDGGPGLDPERLDACTREIFPNGWDDL